MVIMPIVNKNMDVPVQCASCPMWDIVPFKGRMLDWCKDAGNIIENPYRRPEWCQLLEAEEIKYTTEMIDRLADRMKAHPIGHEIAVYKTKEGSYFAKASTTFETDPGIGPCPFCGGKADLMNGVMSCSQCGAEVLFQDLLNSDMVGENYDKEFIRKWNSRHE